MTIDRQTLDSMLNDWARFYLSEFNEVSWSRLSMSGKIMEYAELGIMSSGTKHEANSFVIPAHIESIVNAIAQLDQKYQQVIKEEYTGKGSHHRKSRKIKLSLVCYKKRLLRARTRLMQII